MAHSNCMSSAQLAKPQADMFRRVADYLDRQLNTPKQVTANHQKVDELSSMLIDSSKAIEKALEEHNALLDELQLAAAELGLLAAVIPDTKEVNHQFIIDNVIVEIEIRFEIIVMGGNAKRSISSLTIKRAGDRLDIASQNSKSLVLFNDTELVIDIAINSLTGTTSEDALRFVMTAIETWTLEHRGEGHYDLVIKFLLLCKLVVHPVERVVNEPVAELPAAPITRSPHTRTYIPHGTMFWRDGHYRSRNGSVHWVEGHWVTR